MTSDLLLVRRFWRRETGSAESSKRRPLVVEVCLQVLVLHLSGEEDALPLAVRGWDGLQLEEVEEHLDLKRQDQVREEV